MDHSLFEEFQTLKNAGLRDQATIALRSFLDSFASLEEKTIWARSYLERGEFGHAIRHELYEQVIFPVLLDGYRRGDPWSLHWLGRTTQNLSRCHHLWNQVDQKSEFEFKSELFRLCPDDDVARVELLDTLVHWFHFAVHEWPAGILYGMDGANLEQCGEIAEAIGQARNLDREQKYAPFLAEFESKLMEYRNRLIPEQS